MRGSLNRTILTSLGLLAGSGIVTEAVAADWTIPHSWKWPLYVRAEVGGQIQTGEPRPAIWTSTGEYQEYGKRYLHPGTDIRGDHGDPVVMPTDGTILYVNDWDNECLVSGSYCRAWFKTDDGSFLYYVSHIDLAPTPATGRHQVVTELREKFVNANTGMGDRSFSVGDKMSTLTMFSADPDGWHHLHLGVVEPAADYRLRDTSLLLEQVPVGETGASHIAVDDEAPVINAVDLVLDQTATNAVQTGVCGDEVWGAIDIVGDIHDTFFTTGTFASFPGLNAQPDSTGIRSARYLVRSLATTEIVAQGTWYDVEGAPVICPTPVPPDRGCLPSLPADDATWIARVDLEQGAFSPGLTILDTLFDVPNSDSGYSTNETYRHILTNSNAVEGAWNATGPNGRYQVSVEATDFAGNAGAFTRFVTVRDPATTLDLTAPGFGDVYVKDNPNDVGAVPSNLGGQPFWESPDIILVPANTPNITVDTPATQSIVTAGVEYWVFVRVHNNGCSPIDNVKARAFSADPSAINTTWRGITPGTEYVGDAANPDGVSVPALGRALLGPFSWTPTVEDAQFGGHRCLLAAVSAPNDGVASGGEFDAPNHNNVGQRNLQVGQCDYQLPNPTTSTATLGITLTTDAHVDAGEVVEAFFDYDPTWFAAWSSVPGVAIQQEGSELVVRMLVSRVVLPDVTLSASQIRTVSFAISLPDGTPTRTVTLDPTLNGAAVAGVSCADDGDSIIH